eukprot:TRINITY_DN12698_c0_g1_i1.p1 TRINITY_DN12698_c0_g1~~TRINITY_DN12698_c0_g1_i1.p1  ORF type:complete len:184 (+),score=37.06 TRINITY_DN12698_c0_g1_i1:223-774(+)
MTSFFNHTKNFRDGAEKFVAFDIDDVKALLERLASGKTIDPDRANENVVLARDWIQHVIEKAGAQQLPLESMKKELESFVDDDRLMLLLRYYQLFSKKLVTSQDRSPVVPLHLTDTNWRLDLQLAGSDLNKVIEPSAFLHFSLTPTQDVSTVDPSFTLEFSKSDLYNFLCELDDIQSQLDEVS